MASREADVLRIIRNDEDEEDHIDSLNVLITELVQGADLPQIRSQQEGHAWRQP